MEAKAVIKPKRHKKKKPRTQGTKFNQYLQIDQLTYDEKVSSDEESEAEKSTITTSIKQNEKVVLYS